MVEASLAVPTQSFQNGFWLMGVFRILRVFGFGRWQELTPEMVGGTTTPPPPQKIKSINLAGISRMGHQAGNVGWVLAAGS